MLRNVEQAGGMDTFLEPRINPSPPRILAKRKEKPATESSVAQG